MFSAGQNRSTEECCKIFFVSIWKLIIKYKFDNKSFCIFLSILDHFQAIKNSGFEPLLSS